jgi:hypothetical protein
VVVKDIGNGALLRVFDLDSGSAHALKVIDKGVQLGRKTYTYNPEGVLFTYSGEIQPAQELVSDAFSDYGIRSDGLVNNYSIPKVNISGETAEDTNAVIYKDLFDGVYEKIENKSGECGPSGITYTWAEANGIVSILVEWMLEDYTRHAPTGYKAYHISAKTGELLTTEKLVQAYGYTIDDFYELVKERIEQEYVRQHEIINQIDSFKEDYEKYYSLAISDKNGRNAIPFVYGSGNLCILGSFTFVGTYDYFTTPINLTGNAEPQLPVFSWDLPEETDLDE